MGRQLSWLIFTLHFKANLSKPQLDCVCVVNFTVESFVTLSLMIARKMFVTGIEEKGTIF